MDSLLLPLYHLWWSSPIKWAITFLQKKVPSPLIYKLMSFFPQIHKFHMFLHQIPQYYTQLEATRSSSLLKANTVFLWMYTFQILPNKPLYVSYWYILKILFLWQKRRVKISRWGNFHISASETSQAHCWRRCLCFFFLFLFFEHVCST